MDIDELTIGQAKLLAAMFGASAVPPSAVQQPETFGIVVVDRGFVYVGRVTPGETYVIRDAHNIRQWGTDESKPGLGYLAINGPTKATKLDKVGVVRVPSRAVISVIDTEAEKWKGI